MRAPFALGVRFCAFLRVFVGLFSPAFLRVFVGLFWLNPREFTRVCALGGCILEALWSLYLGQEWVCMCVCVYACLDFSKMRARFALGVRFCASL